MAVRGVLLALNILNVYLLLNSRARIQLSVFSVETFHEGVLLIKTGRIDLGHEILAKTRARTRHERRRLGFKCSTGHVHAKKYLFLSFLLTSNDVHVHHQCIECLSKFHDGSNTKRIQGKTTFENRVCINCLFISSESFFDDERFQEIISNPTSLL